MATRTKINAGDRYGSLTVLKEVEPNITPCGTKQRKFLVKCDCGKEYVLARQSLIHGNKQSCGCRWIPTSRKYSDAQRESFLYSTWQGMKRRCYNPNTEGYEYYGGRGIKMCDEWLNDYVAFYNWAILNGASQELSIDRIDVNGDYCPENCRWADAQTQARNTRVNRYIEYNGKRKLLLEWAEEVGIPSEVIRHRIFSYGWPVGEALGFEEHITVMPERPQTRKAVLQYTLDGEFVREWPSLKDIEKELKFTAKSIRNCCSGAVFSSHGYKWEFKDKIALSDKQKDKIKTVEQYSLDGTFIREWSSAKDAGEALNISPSGISKICGSNKKGHKHCGGYQWRYKDDDRPITPVEDYIVNEIWEYNGASKTIKEWAKSVNIEPHVLYGRFQRGWTIAQALGFEHHFRGGSSTNKLILQLDSDNNVVKEWTSLHYIRKELGRSKNQIRRCLETGAQDIHGYFWKFKE